MNCQLKKIFFLVVCVIMQMLAGCGSSTEKKVVIAVGGAPSEIDFWEKIISDCEKITGIDIELLRQPTDTDQRRQSLVTALRAKKSTPDIFLMDVAWIAQFAASNWLERLDTCSDSINRISAEPFFKPVVQGVDIWNGALIALPVYVDGGLLYYRKDLLAKYGFDNPPQTWDDLVRQAQKVINGERKKNPSFTGFVWQGAQYEGLVCNFLEFAGSNGAGIQVEKSSGVINSNKNVKAVTFMRDLIHKEKISPFNTYTDMKEEQVRQVFGKGNALFERNWPYAWKLHESNGSHVQGKVGIALLPRFPSGKSASTLGGWHIGISRFSKNKEKAYRCTAFLLSADVQKKFTLNLGWNPGRISVYDDPQVKKALPHLEILKEVFNHTVARPNVPYYSYISNVVQRYVNSVLAGKADAEEALNKCESEVVRIIGQYKQN